MRSPVILAGAAAALLYLVAGQTLAAAQPPPAPAPGRAMPLFDGKALAGWEGDATLWRVEDGAITGGSLTTTVKQNEFLATTRNFTNFIVRFRIRLTGSEGFINSGFQVRSRGVPRSSEMAGYQCDYGEPDWDWGRLGIQVHGGGKALVQVKDITAEELPSGAGGARFLGAPSPGPAAKPSPLTAPEEHATFTLAPGFELELVAQESEGIGKFVAVDWDLQGRLWSMTALEYPVDANENAAAARELYASRAKDKVLVFDRPYGPGPHSPRVFADGLAIPLGVLPYRNGVYVQHGQEIVFLSDTDNDGRADKREVVLSGFGVQDSHLFPHQFTRAPGDWIWDATGRELALRLVSGFKLAALEGPINEALTAVPPLVAREILPALRALRALGANRLEGILAHVRSPEREIADEAVAALASSRNAQAPSLLFARFWGGLSSAQRRAALGSLTGTAQGARATVTALRDGSLPRKAGFTRLSMMPEGLLKGLQPREVSDLFAYLTTLK